jgi:hypothetical protein
MELILSLRKGCLGMIRGNAPRGRNNLPKELMQFGINYVFAEGTKTERYYVENIKKNIASKYSVHPNDINIVIPPMNQTKNTVELVKFAISEINKIRKSGKSVDNVWIFFDKDDFPAERYQQTFDLIKSLTSNDSEEKYNDYGFLCDSKNTAWIPCWSNRCFELFYCLYFEYFQKAVSSTEEYIESINKQLKTIGFSYEKNQDGIHDCLTKCGGRLTDAIKYAKKLNESNQKGNPSSGAYKFPEFFYKYLSDYQKQ